MCIIYRKEVSALSKRKKKKSGDKIHNATDIIELITAILSLIVLVVEAIKTISK